MQTADPHDVMTVREVADYLRVNQRTVYRLAVDKKLPAFKVGATWRFRRAEIDAWISAQHLPSGADLEATGRASQVPGEL